MTMSVNLNISRTTGWISDILLVLLISSIFLQCSASWKFFNYIIDAQGEILVGQLHINVAKTGIQDLVQGHFDMFKNQK